MSHLIEATLFAFNCFHFLCFKHWFTVFPQQYVLYLNSPAGPRSTVGRAPDLLVRGLGWISGLATHFRFSIP